MATVESKEAAAANGPSKPVKSYEIDKFFRICMKLGGSDLHLKVGLPVMIRHKGEIRQMDMPPISESEMARLCMAILDERQRRIFDEEGGVDFAHVIGDAEARFRVNLFKQRGHVGMVARLVNATILPFEKLFLPPVLGEVALLPQGLIILAGITGSGKSTTIASMLHYVNQRRRCHILTVEDPIEYLFKDDKAVINQREVGIDVLNWEIALKHAVREDPDVILVGEMRDRDTFSAAVHAAETGHLVFGTIHASSSASTISRILDLFPAEDHHAIRQSLSFNLRAVVAQKLVKTTDDWQKKGIGRVPINEVMVVNPSIRKAIAEGLDERLSDIIRSCENEGMQDFTKALVDRVESEMITREAAFEIAPNPDALKMALKGIKLPVSGLA
jgi:twitching motility protein PilT